MAASKDGHLTFVRLSNVSSMHVMFLLSTHPPLRGSRFGPDVRAGIIEENLNWPDGPFTPGAVAEARIVIVRRDHRLFVIQVEMLSFKTRRTVMAR